VAGLRRDGVRVLGSRVGIAGRSHAVSGKATIAGGDLVVLSGPSGSGKTTLLRSIAERRPSRVELGYLAQDLGRAFPGEMPVRELLGPERGARLDVLRRWFGPELNDRLLSRTVAALSEGERQRLLLASEVLRLDRAGGARLKLLLLDEPFGSLDPAAHLRLMEALLGWVRESADRAAVLVSHRPMVDLGLARAFGVPAREWTIGAEAA
jgi:ABC-type multidrug transport system ATPase subunit